MVRSAPPTKLPSAGISLGESGSDLFHISRPLRNNLSIFWEIGDLTQYAKNLFMVIVDLLWLLISILSSLVVGFVSVLRNTAAQIGAEGDTGVSVGAGLFVDVKIGVFVRVGAGVFVGGFVIVGVGVLVLEGVILGSTTSV